MVFIKVPKCDFRLSRDSTMYIAMFFTDITLFYVIPLVLSVVLYTLISIMLLYTAPRLSLNDVFSFKLKYHKYNLFEKNLQFQQGFIERIQFHKLIINEVWTWLPRIPLTIRMVFCDNSSFNSTNMSWRLTTCQSQVKKHIFYSISQNF